jgi:translation initiation factor IF-1
MAKQAAVELDGAVTTILPDRRFRVVLDNGAEVLATTASRMKAERFRVGEGDRVTVEVSPYDLSRGRIIRRFPEP